VVAVVATPCLWFILAPFPGMGLVYSITDPLRGHPNRPHGSHSAALLGLWVKDGPIDFGYFANALALSPNGKFSRTTGMSRYSWHNDDSRLYLDYVSGCGNCYAGVVTREYRIEFDGSDRIRLTPVSTGRVNDVEGWYTRTEVTDELVAKMESLKDVEDYAISSQAMSVLDAIEHMRQGR
jgi:hypothetical protein